MDTETVRGSGSLPSVGKGTIAMDRGELRHGMKTQDQGRKWMWGLLGAIALFQMYFVRELLAAFALFAVVFAVIATFAVGIYVAQKSWELAVARVAESNHPAVHLARRSVSSKRRIPKKAMMPRIGPTKRSRTRKMMRGASMNWMSGRD